MRKSDIHVERNRDGSYTVSAIVDDYREHLRCFFCTKREAVQMFFEHVKEQQSKIIRCK